MSSDEKSFPPFSLLFRDYGELSDICHASLKSSGKTRTVIGRVPGFLNRPNINQFGFEVVQNKGVTFADPEQIEQKIFRLPKFYNVGPAIGNLILDFVRLQTSVSEDTIASINSALDGYSFDATPVPNLTDS